MAKTRFCSSDFDRAESRFYTTCVIVALFTRKAGEWCTNATAAGAMIVSGAGLAITAGKRIVVCPTCLVATIASLINKIKN